MNKVLIIGSDFRWYNESYKQCFQELDCDVRVIETKMGVDKNEYLVRIKRLLGIDVSDYNLRKIESQSKIIKKEFIDFKPDLVFVRTGNQINYETVKYMSNHSITVLFLSDSLERYTQLRNVVSAYSKIYSFEKSDIAVLQLMGIQGEALMGTFDEHQYYPIDCTKDIDISFVGVMYPFRKELLSKLASDFSAYKLTFYGQYIASHELIKLFRYMIGKEKKIFTNKNIHYIDVNKLYNRSKICLNLQHPQSKGGWNSRLCEILGTKSFQIVNSNPEIKTVFDEGLETFDSYDELKCKISFYLNKENLRIQLAEKGYKVVTDKFTTKQSVERILRDTLFSEINETGVVNEC